MRLAPTVRTTALLVGLALTTAACTNPYDPGQRALGGGLIGAGTGAAIGGLAGGGRGAAIGAGLGGVTGALVGAATTPQAAPRQPYYGQPGGYYQQPPAYYAPPPQPPRWYGY